MLLNCSEDLDDKSTVDQLNNLSVKMKTSGYNTEFSADRMKTRKSYGACDINLGVQITKKTQINITEHLSFSF